MINKSECVLLLHTCPFWRTWHSVSTTVSKTHEKHTIPAASLGEGAEERTPHQCPQTTVPPSPRRARLKVTVRQTLSPPQALSTPCKADSGSGTKYLWVISGTFFIPGTRSHTAGQRGACPTRPGDVHALSHPVGLPKGPQAAALWRKLI